MIMYYMVFLLMCLQCVNGNGQNLCVVSIVGLLWVAMLLILKTNFEKECWWWEEEEYITNYTWKSLDFNLDTFSLEYFFLLQNFKHLDDVLIEHFLWNKKLIDFNITYCMIWWQIIAKLCHQIYVSTINVAHGNLVQIVVPLHIFLFHEGTWNIRSLVFNVMFIIFLLYLLGDVGKIFELLSFIGVAKCLCF